MVVQVKHEAEVSRQHARYRIPAKIEIERVEYSVREWSVSGFSAAGVAGDLTTWNTHRDGAMSFDLETFRLSLDLSFEILSHDPEDGLLRARFVNVSKRDLSLLHYVIDAYLSGEVVTAGDVLAIAGRDNFVRKNLDERLDEPLGEAARLRRLAAKIAGQLTMLVTLTLLLAFVGFKLYGRLVLVEAESARIRGPVVILRAPGNGIFEINRSDEGPATRGEFLGMVKLIGGGAAGVESPCDCRLLEVLSFDGAFVGRGEPLLALLPGDARLQVEARIAFEDVARVRVGDGVRVRLSDGSVVRGRVEKLLASDRLADLRAAALKDVSQGSRSAAVIIHTEEPLPTAMLDTVAAVTINTFWD